jgi:hypothetical protein
LSKFLQTNKTTKNCIHFLNNCSPSIKHQWFTHSLFDRKPEEFELEDEIELLAPDEVTEFDSYDTGSISQVRQTAVKPALNRTCI